MERFWPESVVELSAELGLVRLAPKELPGVFGLAFLGKIGIHTILSYSLPRLAAERLRSALGAAERDCLAHGLSASAKSIQRAIALLSTPSFKWVDLQRLAEEIHSRLRDELSSAMFLSLGLQESHLYEEPRGGWEPIISRFEGTDRDIEGASKCIATGMNTACVFHLMRVAEVGVRELGKSLNDPKLDPKNNPSWEAILGRCDREQQKPLKARSEEWQREELFFSTATANLRAVKDAWRNPTMHVEQHYDADEARGIYAAVRAFLRHLATRLPLSPAS